MLTQKEMENAADCISDATSKGDTTFLIGSIAHSLLRIANAQEALYELSQTDLQNVVEAEIQSRAQALANELQEEKTKRSFIGKGK